MLLRGSGERNGETYDLRGVTSTDDTTIGVPNESFLLRLTGAMVARDANALPTLRAEGRALLGDQALCDAIAVAAAFNGITKVANATGIPLDANVEQTTVAMRATTGIDAYAESHKAALYAGQGGE